MASTTKGYERIGAVILITILIVLNTHLIQAQENKDTTYTLSSGKQIRLPLHYKSWNWMMASWSVPVAEIVDLLPDSLIPITVSKGQAIISIGAYHYPEVNGLAPYDEFLISIPVQYNKTSKPNDAIHYNPLFPQDVYYKGGSFIYYLPVTTEQSKEAGSEIWGFPKVVRRIVFEEDDRIKRCKLYDGDDLELILEIEKVAVPSQRKSFTYCSYTEKKGTLLRTCVNATGNYVVKQRGARATIIFGEGKVARQLKAFRLSKNPIQVFFAENVESDLAMACDVFLK